MLLYSDFPSWISAYIIPGLPFKWYSAMYLFSFATSFIVFRIFCKQGGLNRMGEDESETLFLYTIIGLLLGARIFSCLFYAGSTYYLTHPWMIVWPIRNGKFVGLPGMSYHGGVIGGIVGVVIYSRKSKRKVLDLTDALVLAAPLGYTFGRIGNFFNGELWGRPTYSSYGIIFPHAPSYSTEINWVKDAALKAGIPFESGDIVNLPRHPSQLYEAFGEGILLFFIMWYLVKPFMKKFGRGFANGCYFIGYGTIRFIIEFFREPNKELGFVIGSLTMGQVLCLIMIIAGVALILFSLKHK